MAGSWLARSKAERVNRAITLEGLGWLESGWPITLLNHGVIEAVAMPLRKAVATVLQIGGVDGLQARAPQAQRRGADG